MVIRDAQAIRHRPGKTGSYAGLRMSDVGETCPELSDGRRGGRKHRLDRVAQRTDEIVCVAKPALRDAAPREPTNRPFEPRR